MEISCNARLLKRDLLMEALVCGVDVSLRIDEEMAGMLWKRLRSLLLSVVAFISVLRLVAARASRGRRSIASSTS